MSAPPTDAAMDMEQQANRLLAKAWADEGFRQRLLADPAATVQAEGVILPPGLGLAVQEGETFHLAHDAAGNTLRVTLPPRPGAELSDTDLEAVAGGTNTSYVSNGSVQHGTGAGSFTTNMPTSFGAAGIPS